VEQHFIHVSDYDLGTSTYRWDLFANTINADSTVTFSSLSSGGLLKSTSGTGQLTLATAGVDYLVTEVGDISAVGSMTTGDAFAGAGADGQWLGLGLTNGRMQFEEIGATDYIGFMSANVGIGTTSPSYIFDVTSGTTDAVARFSSSDDLAQILLSDNDTTGYLNIKDSIFSIGLTSGLSANNLNINSSGNIGIGTTTPGTYKLYVAGNLIATSYFASDGTQGADATVSGLVFKDGLYTSGTLPPFLLTETGDISEVLAGDGLTGGGSSGSVTLDVVATNGLTDTADAVKLGGSLTETTTITQGNFDMVFNLDGTGNFDIQNTGVSSLYISGSSGNVGIGTTAPDYDLDVLGTIQGYNFLTSGGMPVNDILLEEEVRNLSITAMTGSLGLDMTSNFVEKISKTNFYADSLWESSALTTLTNGNVLIAFHGAAGGGEALFAIYDSVGGLVTSGNLNQGDSASGLSTTSLTNGNVLIAYRDDTNSGYGTFVIYDSAGNLVKSETVFNSGDTSYSSKISATTLTNGNVLIAYRDDTNSGYGTFVSN